jgi:glycosyltransferase involved in cell wall biosynthesis
MKIALLHYSALPVVGGVERVIGQHARLMADAGHEVRVVAGRGAQVDKRIRFARIAALDSRHAQVLKIKAELDVGRLPVGFAPFAERLASWLRRLLADVDVVIAHNVASLHKNLALTAALRQLRDAGTTTRLILWHHDLAWTTPRYRAELHNGYPWDLLRTDWPGVQHVAVSELRQRELAGLLGLPAARIAVVPNGIDIAAFLKLEPMTVGFVKQLSLLSSRPLLLLPVRITRRKNIELALHLLAALRQSYPRAALVVTGPLGPHDPTNIQYFESLTALRAQLGLTGAAHFLTGLTREVLPDAVIADFYRLADGLFLPSREEGFGLPLLEAGLAGVPVFCSDIEPLRKLGGAEAVYFSPDAAPAELAARIVSRLEADPAFGLRQRVREQYAWEGIYQARIAPLLEIRNRDEN